MNLFSGMLSFIFLLSYLVLLGIALVLAIRRTRSSDSLFDKVGSWFVFVVLLLILIFLIANTHSIALWKIYERVTATIAANSNLNEYLIRAIVLVWLIPALWVMVLVKSRKGSRRRFGYALSALYLASFYFGMYFLTKDNLASQYYAITPEGYYFSPRPGADPKYGIELKRVTADAVREYRILRERGYLKEDRLAKQTGFFDPLLPYANKWTADPPIPNARLFDRPGIDTLSGKQLMPVDTAWVAAYLKAKEKATSDSIAGAHNREAVQLADRANRRLEETKSRYLADNVSSLALGLIALEREAGGRGIMQHEFVAILGQELQKSGISSGPLLKDAAAIDGVAPAIIAGNWSIYAFMQSLSCSVLGLEVRGQEVSATERANVHTWSLSVTFKLYDRKGMLRDSGVTSGSGAGFNSAAARKAAEERVAADLAKELIPFIKQ